MPNISNSNLKWLTTSIGKKVLVAITGLIMYGFVVGHMIGNFKTFAGVNEATGDHKLDEYAKFLRDFGGELLGHETALWLFRIVLLGAVITHIILVIQLKIRSKKARPVGYAVVKNSCASIASRTMFWGGLILASFIVFHILHLTIGSFSYFNFVEGEVYANVYYAFQSAPVLVFYTLAILALSFHISHGFWSVFQTLGVDRPQTNQLIRFLSSASALILLFGFLSVPYAIYFGVLMPPGSK
jgi:succinate dehydrogenase / fumarate reductase cytochrome b subunit